MLDMQLITIKRRADFLRVRGGLRWSTVSFSLEAREREQVSDLGAGEVARFGFTVTKKIGDAVVRNRIKRRLREAVRHSASPFAHPDFDYVLFARNGALDRRFADLQSDVQVALQRVHDKGKANSKAKMVLEPLPEADGIASSPQSQSTPGADHSAAQRKPRTPAWD